jgi:hypothetical protein
MGTFLVYKSDSIRTSIYCVWDVAGGARSHLRNQGMPVCFLSEGTSDLPFSTAKRQRIASSRLISFLMDHHLLAPFEQSRILALTRGHTRIQSLHSPLPSQRPPLRPLRHHTSPRSLASVIPTRRRQDSARKGGHVTPTSHCTCLSLSSFYKLHLRYVACSHYRLHTSRDRLLMACCVM